jgi:hypothetical protein
MVQVTVVQMASVTVIRTDFHRYSILFPPEGGVGLVPKRGSLLTLAYYAFQR